MAGTRGRRLQSNCLKSPTKPAVRSWAVQVVGCIVEHQGRVLLCKRAIEPCRGLWTLPAGYLEIGEGSAAGAARETWEEACARVEVRVHRLLLSGWRRARRACPTPRTSSPGRSSACCVRARPVCSACMDKRPAQPRRAVTSASSCACWAPGAAGGQAPGRSARRVRPRGRTLRGRC